MIHKSVVRNEAYQTGSFNTRERHNERKNETYFNSDIEPERAHLNIHFCQHFKADGEAETYEETFNRLLAEGKIVKHGTKPDAKLFCEMVFDINTLYFDENGGYEYAKKFFEEAYRLAVKEAGSEDYILSAAMHADERNKALSEQLGRDVYHYHLHVVYVPVVEKKLYFKKNNKNPELAGKLKEIIPQISQSNKWPLRMQGERNGKTVTLNSYSFLQDRYFEHMKAAGFDGFERGEHGYTAEHLDVLDFKIKQDTVRAETATAIADEKEKEVAVLDEKIERKRNRITILDKKIEDRNFVQADIKEINKIGKTKNVFGQIVVTPEELDYVKSFAREGATSRITISELEQHIKNVEHERDNWKKSYTNLWNEVKGFIQAIRSFPQKLLGFINEQWQERQQNRQQQKSHNREIR